MYYDVFISHDVKTELDLAIRIKEKLWDKRKIKAFVARDDMPFDSSDWDNDITDAIKNSRSLLVLYNEEASESRTVKGEMHKANDFKRAVIIFKEKEVLNSKIPLDFRMAQHHTFDIKNEEDLLNRVLEMRWKKNPNTIPAFHDLYEKAKEYRILTPSLTSDEFLTDVKKRLEYVFEYILQEKLPGTEKYYTELYKLIKKMLDEKKIAKTEEYEKLERREGTKKAVYTLSVGIWKEGLHKGIL